MRIAYIDISNFRGISKAHISFNDHAVLIGDNNAGKSTIFEAIDLVLGPDRLHRTPIVDEHDFYNGNYFISDTEIPEILIEVLVTDLNTDQLNRFAQNIEFWDGATEVLLKEGEIEQVDKTTVKEALRVKFVGKYDPDEDDFTGDTFFCSPVKDDGVPQTFKKSDKRECGFLYLRALRTGSRALSMERGSLLDIILKIREVRPKMWENILTQLRAAEVAKDPAVGIKDILVGVQDSLKQFVPSDWGTEPHLKVSDLTREHLRKTLTIFLSTGQGSYSAPFQHQGTGTINLMVLALLSMIADEKMNVIFAMEEPEIAIPPYTQKRIINSIRGKSTQAIFTSHSPFVLEEFSPSQIILIQRDKTGVVESKAVEFPSIIKPKAYNTEFRLRFAEALLAKRVLLTEGATEAAAYSAAARRLNELKPDTYLSLEALGIAVFDAQSESNIATMGNYFTSLGKTVFAVFDKQAPDTLKKIKDAVKYPYESKHKGFEDLLLEETPIDTLEQFLKELIKEGDWPSHIAKPSSFTAENVKKALNDYFRWSKGHKSASELIGSATKVEQIPITVRDVLVDIIDPIL